MSRGLTTRTTAERELLTIYRRQEALAQKAIVMYAGLMDEISDIGKPGHRPAGSRETLIRILKRRSRARKGGAR